MPDDIVIIPLSNTIVFPVFISLLYTCIYCHTSRISSYTGACVFIRLSTGLASPVSWWLIVHVCPLCVRCMGFIVSVPMNCTRSPCDVKDTLYPLARIQNILSSIFCPRFARVRNPSLTSCVRWVFCWHTKT